jgi:hypothetical protein
MNWDEMDATENGRFCGKCRKEVLDLTNCSIDEVIALQRKHGPICGLIKVAAVAISLSAAACQNPTQDRTTGAPMPPRPSNSISGGIWPADQLEQKREVGYPEKFSRRSNLRKWAHPQNLWAVLGSGRSPN